MCPQAQEEVTTLKRKFEVIEEEKHKKSIQIEGLQEQVAIAVRSHPVNSKLKHDDPFHKY